MNIWNRHFECMNRNEMRIVQGERLRETVERVYFHVPYYRQKIQQNLESSLGLSIKITVVEPKTLERSDGKSKRVIDKRNF